MFLMHDILAVVGLVKYTDTLDYVIVGEGWAKKKLFLIQYAKKNFLIKVLNNFNALIGHFGH